MRSDARSPTTVIVIVLLTIFMLAIGVGCLILLPGPVGDVVRGRPGEEFGAARRIPAWWAVIGLSVGALAGLGEAWRNLRWLLTGESPSPRGRSRSSGR